MPIDHLLDNTASSPHYSKRTAYNPIRRTPAASVTIPISRLDLVQCQTSTNPLRNRTEVHLPSHEAARSTVSPAPGLAGLPQRPDSGSSWSNGMNGKRGYERDDREDGRKRARAHEDVRAVANHYNARPNINRDARNDSPIIGLKNFNNWTKSVLIAKFGRREGDVAPKIRVLDLGCGKGGDLQKWLKAGTSDYVGLDLAEVSVAQAQDRYDGLRSKDKFRAKFFASDCFKSPIESVLEPDPQLPSSQEKLVQPLFDVVSMQFCMHYAFESEDKARMMLSNAVRYLKPGGRLIGTIPDSSNLLGRLDTIPPEEEDLTFGNSVYGIKFDSRSPPMTDAGQVSLFGHRYTFFLQDAVEEVPEYVVYWDGFVDLAAEYGLQLTFHEDFQRIFVEERADAQFADLLKRMRVVDSEGDTEMTMDQWEAATLYVGFAFTKV